MKPLISVIIPVYNVENYILKCIESVTDQDFNNIIEIILIDDCSQDQSIEIIKNYIKTIDRKDRLFKILKHKKNRRQGAARNTGIQNSEADLIVFVDSDDILPKSALSVMFSHYISCKCDIIESENMQFKEVNSILDKKTLKNFEPYNLSKDEVWDLGNKWGTVAWAKLIKKDFLLKNNLWFKENMFIEDVLWAVQIALANPIIRKIPDVTYHYRIREDSSAHNLGRKHFENYIKFIEELNKLMVENIDNWNDYQKNQFLRTFELLRIVLVDSVYRNYNKAFQKEFLNKTLIFKNLSLIKILKAPCFTKKQKIKIIPLYCGNMAHTLIILKSKLSKLISLLKGHNF